MSFARLNLFLSEIGKVVRLESGEKEEKPLEGMTGVHLANQMFGKEKK